MARRGTHTSSIGQFILLSLDLVLERLGFATRELNARLHGLWRHIVLILRRIHRDVTGRARINPCDVELAG